MRDQLFKKLSAPLVILCITAVLISTAYAQGADEQKEVSVGLAQQIGNFYAWALGIGGLIALGVLVFGGILYTASAGNASRQDDAKQWITGSFIGLALLFGSWFILNTINPELTKLTDLKLLANKAAESLTGSGEFPAQEGGVVVIDGKTCPLGNNPAISDSCDAPRSVGAAGGRHAGIDIFASLGTPLYAMENGVIGDRWGWDNAGGWRFWLYGDSGDKYYYAHTYSMDGVPRPGTRVNVGDQVGRVGNTGETAPRTGGEPGAQFASHLHLGWKSAAGGASCGLPSEGYHNPTRLLKALCEAGVGGAADVTVGAPELTQVLNKPQYRSFGVSFQEIGGQGASVNSNKQLQSASLYKLFVAKYLYEQREKGRISFDTTVDLSRIDLAYAKREDQRDGTPYPWGTKTKIPIKECLPQMISASENACGAALKAFARDLAGGESQINAQSGGNSTLYPQRTTAGDVANLLSQIAQGELVNQAVSAEFERLLQSQIHQGKIPKGVPSGAQVGNKTGEIWPDEGLGYTNSHDAAIIRYNGKTYILVVLTTYSPADGRTNQTIQQLTRELFATLK